MKLATIKDGSRDGRLVVVSKDLTKAAYAPDPYRTLQQALDDWAKAEPALRSIKPEAFPFDPAQAMAPLPRAWQWLDGSAFSSHGELMDKVLGITPEKTGKPLMYQGVSNPFLAASQDVTLPDTALGIDFEGEFGIIIDHVPMGTPAGKAMGHIKLLLLINDWSLRKLAGPEMKTGFGWVQAKPPCSASPVAVTPDELGPAWHEGRVHLNLRVHWNGKQFGNAHGGAMGHGFHELVAHAAFTRELVAGTVIGSGTVSNPNYREVGSSCIAERRGIEIVDHGAPTTEFMAFGDTVRLESFAPDGTSLFGAIDQKVVSP